MFDSELKIWCRRINIKLKEITEVPLLISYIKCQRENTTMWLSMGNQKPPTREQQLNRNQQGKDQEEGLERDGWME